MNLADAIAKWANLTPAKTAVIDTTSDRRISFAELHADINRLTRGLISRGIAKGDRVAVLSMNSIEYLTVYYACARAGFIAQPMNWRLSAHFHMLYLNGVYDANGYFWPVKPPTPGDLDEITHKIAKRVSRYLERAGHLYRDAESEYLDLVPDEEDAMHGIIGASITYRLAFGPNAGRKALTLQAVPTGDNRAKSSELVSKQSGFSLHAGVACKSNQRKKLERLCRYITRPAISEQRLSLASNGNVIVALKTPYDDGTSHVVLSPMEFMGRLAALVPKPRVNLIRFHGVFSPRSRLRAHVVPGKPDDESEQAPQSGRGKSYSMTWAQRLKRVFAIEIETCEKCGGNVKIIASIEDPDVIEKILKHLGLDEAPQARNRSPPAGLSPHSTQLF